MSRLVTPFFWFLSPSAFLVFMFQTSRTCPPRFKKNCSTRCWTETYKKVKHLLCLLRDLKCNWYDREKPDPSRKRWSCGLANRKSPLTNCILYREGCRLLAVLYYLYIPSCQCMFCLPACLSLCLAICLVVCTSCVWPNQPNWVLGISLIPSEWLYFLSAHTRIYKHKFKKASLFWKHFLSLVNCVFVCLV